MHQLNATFPLGINQDIFLDLMQLHQAPILFDLIDSNRAYLRTWLPWVDKCQCIADSEQFIRQATASYEQNQALTLGVWYQTRLVGVINLHHFDRRKRTASIGYWLDEAHQGKGIMTRACQELISFGFSSLCLQRVSISCAVENTRSQALAQRLGFTLEETVKNKAWLYDRYVDHHVYALSSSS